MVPFNFDNVQLMLEDWNPNNVDQVDKAIGIFSYQNFFKSDYPRNFLSHKYYNKKNVLRYRTGKEKGALESKLRST